MAEQDTQRPGKGDDPADPPPEETVAAGWQTVCICRGIRRRTIESAIRGGARSYDQIRRRTRAMTGPCGAKRCGPRIDEMLAAIPATPGAAQTDPPAPRGRDRGRDGPRPPQRHLDLEPAARPAPEESRPRQRHLDLDSPEGGDSPRKKKRRRNRRRRSGGG